MIPTPVGPVIGPYGGVEIAEAVIDTFGRRFVYVGIAPRQQNGRFDDQALGPGEFILKPGLVYRHDKASKALDRSQTEISLRMPPSTCRNPQL